MKNVFLVALFLSLNIVNPFAYSMSHMFKIGGSVNQGN